MRTAKKRHHANLRTHAGLNIHTSDGHTHTRHDITSYGHLYDVITGARILLLKGYQSNSSSADYHTSLLKHNPNCHGVVLPKG